MNEIRKEKEERAYLLDLAIKDKDKLRNFTRLVDYIVCESLISINNKSYEMLIEEMRKDRKTGLFNTQIMFEPEPGQMQYTPDKNDVIENLSSLLDDMILCVK
jgi:hypothetical protein